MVSAYGCICSSRPHTRTRTEIMRQTQTHHRTPSPLTQLKDNTHNFCATRTRERALWRNRGTGAPKKKCECVSVFIMVVCVRVWMGNIRKRLKCARARTWNRSKQCISQRFPNGLHICEHTHTHVLMFDASMHNCTHLIVQTYRRTCAYKASHVSMFILLVTYKEHTRCQLVFSRTLHSFTLLHLTYICSLRGKELWATCIYFDIFDNV